MHTLLSTNDVHPHETKAFWSDVVSQVYAPCQRIELSHQFKAEAEIVRFGVGEISHVISRGVNYERQSNHCLLDQKDDIFISIMLNGEGFLTQFNQQVKQKKGDVLIHDSAFAYLYEYPKAYRSLYYRIPRDFLSSYGFDIDKLGGTLIPSQSPYAKAINAFLITTYQLIDDDETQIGEDISLPLIQTLSHCLSRVIPVRSVQHQRLMELNNAKRWMMEHIEDDALTLDDIASNCHRTVRSLNRLFADFGESPIQWLKSQRLLKAHSLLNHPHQQSITEIAFQCGFNDISRFGKLFRAKFGCSPSELRKTN